MEERDFRFLSVVRYVLFLHWEPGRSGLDQSEVREKQLFIISFIFLFFFPRMSGFPHLIHFRFQYHVYAEHTSGYTYDIIRYTLNRL